MASSPLSALQTLISKPKYQLAAKGLAGMKWIKPKVLLLCRTRPQVSDMELSCQHGARFEQPIYSASKSVGRFWCILCVDTIPILPSAPQYLEIDASKEEPLKNDHSPSVLDYGGC